ncbi:MAG: tetratricopeptide repeat protein, partial [Planctomycetota bacterium]
MIFTTKSNLSCGNFVPLSVVFVLSLLLSGCNSDSGKDDASTKASGLTKSEESSPIVTIKRASQLQDWAKAWTACELLFEQRNLEPETGIPRQTEDRTQRLSAASWIMIARVAHETERLSEAANYLWRACETESFASAARIQQTLVAMVEAGRLTDGMIFLEAALLRRPELDDAKRLLFDLYAGSDDRVKAMELGRQLVRSRRFDLELLVALGNTQRRRDDPEPLNEMLNRNPSDKRPKLGLAKVKFDQRKFEDAEAILREIVEAHPDHHPTQVVLGQTLVASGKL